MDEHVILFSGGPDSLIGYYWVLANYGKTPLGLYIPLGHKYQDREKYAVDLFKNKWTMQVDQGPAVESIGLFEKPDATILGRNLLLAYVAAHFNANHIWIVAQEGEMSIPDRTPAFFERTSNLLSFLFAGDIAVDTMFKDMTKSEMVEWFLESPQIDLTKKERELMLRDTYSCYAGGFNHCGRCPACFRRWAAFSLNGIDEGRMFKGIEESEIATTYYEAAVKGKYTGKRAHEIRTAIIDAKLKKGDKE